MEKKSVDFIRRFAKAAAIRAVRTFAQTAVATLSASRFGLLSSVDWKGVLSAASLAAIGSLFTSLAAGLPEMKLPAFPQNDAP